MWDLSGISPKVVERKKGDSLSGTVETSAEMRQKLAEDGRPVLVSFSRGKDSICAMIALMAAGVEVIPVHLWRVPGLSFEEESLKKFEEFFGMKIYNLPHRDFWYMLYHGVNTAPWQEAIIEAAGIEEVPFPAFWDMVRYELGLDEDTWVADGVRANDSPMRRLSIQRNGPWTANVKRIRGEEYLTRTAHVVWDWSIADIRRCIAQNNVDLPVDYDLFKRTFDGVDYRFMQPMRDKLPDDYQKCLDWFPGIEMEMMRYEHL
ncbi:hypothetical protein [Corynebacterium accolens]|uniref:hypothetical protein n=1 Tax=Corynebacterium accolens TaxID=38284 RepID=UPI002542C82C|nr:hypothetical protein [Corynebacterium accolens]MDK4338306.1 hypothetical protein [Corynebacterium accolens]